jgi:hypothetical protein
MKRYACWASAIAILSAAFVGCAETGANGGNAGGGAGGATGGVGGASGGAGGVGGATGGVGGATGGIGGAGGATGGVGGASGGAGGVGGGGMGGVGGDGGMGGSGGGAPTSGSCLPATEVDTLKGGPHPFTHIEDGGPTGESWVFYPEDIGKDGMVHPIFTWGPGAFTAPSNYVDHLNHLASHGFVVISQVSSGSGADEIAALDWIIEQNEVSGSPFHQKLDITKVGAGGHSLGALTTMAMAADPRLNAYVLVCGGCMSGRGDCGAADIHAPTVILGGDADMGTPPFEADYAAITTPAVFVIKDGTDHFACARENLSPWTAFLRWQFCGEEQWKPYFMAGGEYCGSPWTCESKGF